MNAQLPSTGLQLQSTVRSEGVLELALVDVEVPRPGPDQVVIRVEGTPINPSDLVLLLASADPGTIEQGGTARLPRLTMPVPQASLAGLAARLDKPMPVGNEGAGVVVAAGESAGAQRLLGHTVAARGGGMYAQFRCVEVDKCLVLPPGTTPQQGASACVNPLTALGMVETMRSEGHSAIVHTAAASTLGQMLQKVCSADGIPLVNVVRRPEQAQLLRSIGATHVIDSSSASFEQDLLDAIAATGATLAFDAIGGGTLAGRILSAMEAVLRGRMTEYNRYGSSVHKQVYVYGGLDRRPIEITRDVGMAWGVGGWLLPLFLQRVDGPTRARLAARVAAEIRTTFASRYARVVSLAEALQPPEIARYAKTSTGEKYLIDPSRGA